MKHDPLTLQEAQALCKDFQHLAGQPYAQSASWTPVISVVVTPYEDINKWIFSRYYAESRNALNALSFYKEHQYDVLVFSASTTNPKWLTYTDLRSYLATHNIPFDITQLQHSFR
ncbi:MAG: hypothetical protein BGO69_00880 [Bacteroidetes bacterium 46-16]|nr:MAG: hypothetical protein BGO69_00880 [Bacteroidetes bacterium 46-16]